MTSARVLARLALAALFALPLAGCDKNLGTLDLSGPFEMQWSVLNVYVQSSAPTDLVLSYSLGGGTPVSVTVAAGQRVRLTSYTSLAALPASDSFSIQRGSTALARVSFQPLHLPEKKGDIKDTTIVIREAAPGPFIVTPLEPDWIRIVDVTQP